MLFKPFMRCLLAAYAAGASGNCPDEHALI